MTKKPGAPLPPPQARTPRETDWVKCPICGESDMRKESEGEEYLINCVNTACASNAGTNADGFAELKSAHRLWEKDHDELVAARQQVERLKLELRAESAPQEAKEFNLGFNAGLECAALKVEALMEHSPQHDRELLAGKIREISEKAAPQEAGALERWEFFYGSSEHHIPPGMSQREKGKWVKFEDVEKLLAGRGVPLEETKK